MYYISVLPVAFPTLRTDMTLKIIKVNAGEKLLLGINQRQTLSFQAKECPDSIVHL